MDIVSVGKQGDVAVLRGCDYWTELLALFLSGVFLVYDCER
jgi:hypothetical protein